MKKEIFHLHPEFEKKYAAASAVAAGGFLHMMGRTPGEHSARTDMAGQIRETYASISTVLRAHGLGLADVVQERIYTTDIQSFFACADIRTSIYGEAAPPATTWVEVRRLLNPDCLVEIEIVAYLG